MSGPDIIPYLSDRDANAAIASLKSAFGLAEHAAYDGEDGKIVHAELSYGTGFEMIGTADLAKGSPGIYLVADDVDAHTREAGAEVVEAPADTPFGTRRWRAKDPEGHEWSFGTCRPGSDTAQ